MRFPSSLRFTTRLIGAEVSGDPATFIARTGQNARLTGTLFTSANGYAGPGDGVGLQTHAIGPQGGASWYSPWCTDSGEGCAGGPDSSVTQTATQYYADDWINAKTAQSWDADLFLYLIDEPLSANLGTYDQWAQWIDGAGSPGNQLQTFITKGAEYQTLMPNIDILAGVVDYTAHADWGDPGDNDLVTNIAPYIASGKAYGYNAKRPLAGSFAVADDGVSPRETMWAMHKYMKICN